MILQELLAMSEASKKGVDATQKYTNSLINDANLRSEFEKSIYGSGIAGYKKRFEDEGWTIIDELDGKKTDSKGFIAKGGDKASGSGIYYIVDEGDGNYWAYKYFRSDKSWDKEVGGKGEEWFTGNLRGDVLGKHPDEKGMQEKFKAWYEKTHKVSEAQTEVRAVVNDAAEDFLAEFFDEELSDSQIEKKVKKHAKQYNISDEAELAYIVKYFKDNI